MNIKIIKEIKEELNCIYNIVNEINGKIYLGSTTQGADTRINEQHVRDLDKNVHENEHLQNAWNLYGADNFYGEVVQYLPDLTQKEVLECEQYELDKIFSLLVKERKQKYYNISEVARGGNHGEETNKKISKANIKRFKDINERNKVSVTCKKSWQDPEKRKKQSEVQKVIQNMPSVKERKRIRMNGENNPMYNKKHSEKSIKKMSIARTGKKDSESTKLKKRKNIKIALNKPETKKKLSESRIKYLKEHPEAIQQLSEASSGEKNGMAKLTWKIVEQVRKDFSFYTGPKMKFCATQAEKYNVGVRTIYNIIQNKIWKI